MTRDVVFDGWIRATAGLPYFRRRLAIRKMTEPPLTRFIYKYRSLEPASKDSEAKLRTLLVESKIWLSAASDFNYLFDLSASVVTTGTRADLEKRIIQLGKLNGISRHEAS